MTVDLFPVTESIFEAVSAIDALERTVQDVSDNPDVLSVSYNSKTYSAVRSTLQVETFTNCAPGQVPVEAVCGKFSHLLSFGTAKTCC